MRYRLTAGFYYIRSHISRYGPSIGSRYFKPDIMQRLVFWYVITDTGFFHAVAVISASGFILSLRSLSCALPDSTPLTFPSTVRRRSWLVPCIICFAGRYTSSLATYKGGSRLPLCVHDLLAPGFILCLPFFGLSLSFVHLTSESFPLHLVRLHRFVVVFYG